MIDLEELNKKEHVALTREECLHIMCAIEMIQDARSGIPIKPSCDLEGEDSILDNELSDDFRKLYDKVSDAAIITNDDVVVSLCDSRIASYSVYYRVQRGDLNRKVVGFVSAPHKQALKDVLDDISDGGDIEIINALEVNDGSFSCEVLHSAGWIDGVDTSVAFCSLMDDVQFLSVWHKPDWREGFPLYSE